MLISGEGAVMAMEFRLLGPLVVRRDGVVVPLPQGKQRALLATLLWHAGQAVSVDELAAARWGATPPPAQVSDHRAGRRTGCVPIRAAVAGRTYGRGRRILARRCGSDYRHC
jgi:hypothetical protein